MKNKFLQGTVILLITSVLLRGLGFVYQILVVRYAGTESVGILNMGFPFYIILVVLATAGMPVAIAKLTAEYISRGREGQITIMMRTAFLLVGLLCFCCVVAALWVMPKLFQLFGTEQRVVRCFYMLIPGIVVVPFTSVMRGYFQGMQQMLYPSLGQMAEQLVRVVSGMIFILWLCPHDVVSLAMGLAAAAMVGELAGFLLLLFFYLYSRQKQKSEIVSLQNRGQVLQSLLALGLPTTFTRLTSSIDMAIEASLVPFCLMAVGYNASQAAGVYGQFSGVAISLVTIPTVLTGALATALIPAVSEADATHQKEALEQRCQQSISITWLFSLPVILVLYVYGEQLGQILFQIHGLGAMMQILSFGAVFMYLEQTIVGILQGLGRTRAVFVNNFFGSAAKLIGMYYCIRTLGWGSNGIAGGMVLGYGLQCFLNLTILARQVRLHLSWGEMLLPVGNSLLMLCIIQMIWNLLGGNIGISLLLAMIVAGCIYLILLVPTGQIGQLTGKRTGKRQKISNKRMSKKMSENNSIK
ncbi:MAG: oligosaccharide flippase family protein [Peptococcaceae bacterium]